MSHDYSLPNRIPFESLDKATTWALPSLSGPAAGRRSAAREAHELEAAVEEVDAPSAALTAAALDEIREAAASEGRAAGFAEGYAEGHAAGLDTGRAEGERMARAEVEAEMAPAQEQIETHLAAITALLDELRVPLAQQRMQLEADLAELAIGVGQALLQQALDTQPERLRGLVEHLLDALPSGAERISLHLHPVDALLLSPHAEPEWVVREDPKLARGSCRVVTTASALEFDVAARLEAYRTQHHPPAPAESPSSDDQVDIAAAAADGSTIAADGSPQ